MTSPALLALTDPSAVPAAAVDRLLSTSAALYRASANPEAAGYASWLETSGAVARALAPLLLLATAGTATDSQAAALVAGERLALGGVRLSDEIARRAGRGARLAAMGWARLHRDMHADLLLTRREYAPDALLGADATAAAAGAIVRLLPGAAAALETLGADPLVRGAAWDLGGLAAALAAWTVRP